MSKTATVNIVIRVAPIAVTRCFNLIPHWPAMTLVTPYLSMLSIDLEGTLPVMIKTPDRPIIRVVTIATICPQATFMFVVRFVTRKTLPLGSTKS